MEMKFTVDTDDIYDGEDSLSFEHLFTDSLKREIIKDAKGKIASDAFKEFTTLVSNSVVDNVKLKMQNFLDEDIAINGRYGEPKFIGSIEDLIKSRFDDVLLRSVDGNGETIVGGCTTKNKTWIEWKIENKLDKGLNSAINQATDLIDRKIDRELKNRLKEITDKTISDKVGSALVNTLKK